MVSERVFSQDLCSPEAEIIWTGELQCTFPAAQSPEEEHTHSSTGCMTSESDNSVYFPGGETVDKKHQ